MKLYYERPMQIQFKDFEGEKCTGIAYKNEIICACCGSVFEIEDLLLNYPQEIKEWKIWIDFTHEIDE